MTSSGLAPASGLRPAWNVLLLSLLPDLACYPEVLIYLAVGTGARVARAPVPAYVPGGIAGGTDSSLHPNSDRDNSVVKLMVEPAVLPLTHASDDSRSRSN